jgi:hypothetical protein
VLAALLMAPAGHLPAIAGDFTPSPFTVTYELRHNAVLLARMERSLQAGADGTWVYESRSSPAGLLGLVRRDHMTERSVWRPAGGHPRPLRYEYHHIGRGSERHAVLEFDWAAHSVTNEINGHAWRMHLPGPVLDKLLYQYALTRDLRNGATEFSYEVADGGGIKIYRFERDGTETLHTRLGTLETVKLHRLDSGSSTTIWCAPALDYMPVRVEQYRDRRIFSLTISALEKPGATPDGAER